MYRIVYFDKKWQFTKVKIVEDFEPYYTEAKEKRLNMKIYKCNTRGNNYSGRMIYCLYEGR